jgi:hypothetical protein
MACTCTVNAYPSLDADRVSREEVLAALDDLIGQPKAAKNLLRNFAGKSSWILNVSRPHRLLKRRD